LDWQTTSQAFLLPIGFLLTGVLVQLLTKQGAVHPNRNDFAVATTTLLMSLAKISGDIFAATDANHKQSGVNWLLGTGLVAIISVSHDRFTSWLPSRGRGRKRLKKFWMGVVLPDAVAFGVFFTYQFIKLKG
jgi:hypothetical protein